VAYLDDSLTPEEAAFLERNCPLICWKGLRKSFVAAFPRHEGVSLQRIMRYCRGRGFPHPIKAGPHANGRRTGWHRYSKKEVAFIRNNAETMDIIAMTDAFNRRFGRSVSRKAIQHKRVRLGKKRAVIRYTREEKEYLAARFGCTPLKKLVADFSERFRPIKVNALRSFCYLMDLNRTEGTEQIVNFRGFDHVFVKPKHSHFRLKHTVVWEAAHGPVPRNSRGILHLDGDTTNCRLDNLALSLNHRIDQRRLLAEVGPGHPELAQTWLQVHNLETMARARKRELNRARKGKETS
jgi:hypothetical protein